jgi:hypothetical protein
MDVRSKHETSREREQVYEELRPLLFSIARGIVGSVSEAEDLVQEAFLRFHRAQREGADIDSPGPGCPRSPPGWPSTRCARPARGGRPTWAPGYRSRC